MSARARLHLEQQGAGVQPAVGVGVGVWREPHSLLAVTNGCQ